MVFQGLLSRVMPEKLCRFTSNVCMLLISISFAYTLSLDTEDPLTGEAMGARLDLNAAANPKVDSQMVIDWENPRKHTNLSEF